MALRDATIENTGFVCGKNVLLTCSYLSCTFSLSVEYESFIITAMYTANKMQLHPTLKEVGHECAHNSKEQCERRYGNKFAQQLGLGICSQGPEMCKAKDYAKSFLFANWNVLL